MQVVSFVKERDTAIAAVPLLIWRFMIQALHPHIIDYANYVLLICCNRYAKKVLINALKRVNEGLGICTIQNHAGSRGGKLREKKNSS